MDRFIGSIKINNKTYEFYIVNKIEGKKTYIGETNYDNGIVKIENGKFKDMQLTLLHELMHIWLYEKGYKNQKDGCFTFEDICEMVAYSHEFIEDAYRFICYGIY